MNVTAHAIDRYIERVEPVSRADAKARIEAAHRAIEAAARFGAAVVRMANGAKLILEGTNVVTVLAPRKINGGPHAVITAQYPEMRA